jgi:hypothetical protein
VLWHVEQVLLALSARIAATRLQFDPSLPAELARRWRATPTWIAPQPGCDSCRQESHPHLFKKMVIKYPGSDT